MIHSEPGRPNELKDVVLADEVTDAEGKEVGVWPVHEEVDHARGHPLVPLLNEVGLEIVVDLARHRVRCC